MVLSRTRGRPIVAVVAIIVGTALLTSAGAAAGASRTVDVLAASYAPATLSVAAGTTIVFRNTSTFPHTATADDGSFDTGLIAAGGSKSVTLSAPGVIPFHCQFHGASGGVGQSGTITVTEAVAATSSPTATGAAALATVAPSIRPPSSDGTPALPDDPRLLPAVVFIVATLASLLVAVGIDLVRGLARQRRSG